MKRHFVLISLTSLVLLLILISAFVLYKDSDYSIYPEAGDLAITSRELNANTISTWFRSNGSFNRDPSTGNAGFYWNFRYARYASGMWIGAKVGNDTLVAVCGYSTEYYNGYTDNSGNPQGYDDPLYRIYKLTLGVNDADRMNWPSILLGNPDQGAPVDYDSLYGILKPADFGAQTMFYRYTDSYPTSHTATNGSTAPLKADVKQLNFGVNSGNSFRNMIFTQFIIINRSSEIWHDAVFNIWTDDDLGTSTDDLIGCDSALKMGYTYNSTNNDPLYGSPAPAVAMLLLKGALEYTGNPDDLVVYCQDHSRKTKVGYRDVGMTGFNSNGIPSNYVQVYRIMNGLQSNGNVITNPAGFTTKLYYSGDPVSNTGWVQTGGADQRFMLSSGPVDVPPGDTQVVSIVQIIARGTSNLNSITVLREYAADAKNYYNSCYGYDPVGINENISLSDDFKLNQNFPNPFNPETVISYNLPHKSDVLIKIYNASGIEIATLVSEKQIEGKHEVRFSGADLPSGIYFYNLTAEYENNVFNQSRKMILVK